MNKPITHFLLIFAFVFASAWRTSLLASSSEKNILAFTISGQMGTSVIDTVHHTVSAIMPSGTSLASLTPTITVSPSATVSPLSGVAESFTSARTYTVRAQDATTQMWTVTVSDMVVPSVTISANHTTICSGTSVTFTAVSVNGGTAPVYQWYKNGIAVGTSATTYTSTALSNGDEVWVTLTSSAPGAIPTSAMSGTITMTVNSIPPAPVLAEHTALCISADTLTASGTGSDSLISWYLGASLEHTGTFTFYVPTAAGSFTAKGTTSVGCVSPASAAVTVSASVSPSVTITSSSTSPCGPVTFAATPVNGGPAPTYEWYKNNVAEGTGTVYSATSLNYNDSVWVRITAPCGSTNPTALSNKIKMTGTPPTEAVSISASNTNLNIAGNPTLTATPVNGGLNPHYAWYHNGALVAGTSPALTYMGALGNGDQMYCTLTTASCGTPQTAASNVVTFTKSGSAEKNITAFTMPGQIGTSVIDTTTATVTCVVSASIALSATHPNSISVSAGATYGPSVANNQNFTAPVIYTVTAQNGNTRAWTVTVTSLIVNSSEKNIVSFTIPSEASGATIDTVHNTVAVLMPPGTNLASLVPTIAVSASAAISPLSGVAESFTAPRTYVVTAGDGTTKSWTVTVTQQLALSSGKNIVTFTIPAEADSAIIDTVHNTVALIMPSGSNLASLVPTITVSPSATISPMSGMGENFSAARTYVVTAQDGSTKSWTVIVTKAGSAEKNITAFLMPGEIGTSVIDTLTATITCTVNSTITLGSTHPTSISISTGATYGPSYANVQNFTVPVIYTVTAQNGTTKAWTVSVSQQTALSGEKNIVTFSIPSQVGASVIDTVHSTVAVTMPSGTNLASLVPTITVSPSATVNPLSGVAESFSAARTYVVTAQDGTTKSWTVTVTVQAALSGEKNIVTFSIPSQVGASVIDTVHNTVAVTMPYGTSLTSLVPTITVSPSAAVNPLSGVAESFSAARTYVVTAQDATTKSWTVTVTAQAAALGTAQSRAATLGNGMNASIWLESSYDFYSTTSFPDVTRFSESDVAALSSLCYNTIRLPVFFEPFASMSAPYTFNMSNQNVVRGLAYVDSMIAWTGTYNMDLIIDNHIADDDADYNMQANYGITDGNYATQAALIAGVWRQAAQRYGYADPERVFFELRNEPNVVGDASLRILYQTVIDTVRKYDHTHTLITGCTGYYDPWALAASTPYSDTEVIYTFHIYDGDGYYGFCEQGLSGENATDTLTRTHISFARTGAQATEITSEVQGVHNWAVTNNVPVWMGEFGCSTYPDVVHDDTSRCNYIDNMAAILNSTSTPWAYWDGYDSYGVYTSFDGGVTLDCTMSMFDASNTISAAHLETCFASALGLGGTCHGVRRDPDAAGAGNDVDLYPNPATSAILIKPSIPAVIGIYNIMGSLMEQAVYDGEPASFNTSAYAPGVYIARIRYADGTYSTKKFLKEK